MEEIKLADLQRLLNLGRHAFKALIENREIGYFKNASGRSMLKVSWVRSWIDQRETGLRENSIKQTPYSMEPLLTLAEVAAALKVSKSTLYKWVEANRIPFLKLPNGAVRFKQETVNDWLERAVQNPFFKYR